MGLDQFAYTIDVGVEDQQDISTWRKHPNLQGFMEALWRAKGGEGEFNCQAVELSKRDVLDLVIAITTQDLPETSGFFFGNDADAYYKEADLEFCNKALKLLEEGKKVYYSSWW